MTDQIVQKINKKLEKNSTPQIRTGNKVKVYQKIKEGNKERVQIFEGVVIAKKHGKGISSTITVRKIINGVGVERIFPVHSPIIEKIEIVSPNIAKRAKIYYIRNMSPKKVREKLRRKGNIVLEEAAAKEEEPTQQEPEKEEAAKNEEKPDSENQEKENGNEQKSQEEKLANADKAETNNEEAKK